MSRWLLASLVPLFVSCTLPSAEEKPKTAPVAASPVVSIDMGEVDDDQAPTDEETTPPVMPTGTFATLEALCAAQEALIAPTLPRARAELTDRGVDRKVVPHCEAVPEALDGVTVDLRAPYLQVVPVQIETGSATELHLAVRIATGWVAIPHASMQTFHDDPGCFTIERDTGLVAVNVIGDEAPSLELVEKSESGSLMDYDEDGTDVVGTWNDVKERTVTCEATAHGFACEDPILLSVARVRSPI